MFRSPFGLLALSFCCRADAAGQFDPSAETPSSVPRAARIVDAAIAEHRRFNGHRIDADGRLWKFGLAESEAESLHDPETGHAGARRSGNVAWRRVWEYWLSLDHYVPGEARSRKLISVNGLLEDGDLSGAYRETELGHLFDELQGKDDPASVALRQAAVRAAMNDSPWSAAFVSHLMHRAGLGADEFHYASAHWRYIQAAFAATEDGAYAYRARDPRDTTPQPGDLLCYARGDTTLKTHEAWRMAVRLPGFSTGAHCEVVVHVDLSAAKLDLIGGNVLQSVARRQLKLNEAHVLSGSHDPDSLSQREKHACQDERPCRKNNLSLQYWSVLLQLKR